MAFDDTLGGSSTTSYVDVAFADDYFSTSYGRNTAWGALDDTSKQNLLIEATRLIDALYEFIGVKASSSQALQWPRAYVPDPSGSYSVQGSNYDTGQLYYPVDVIIPPIKQSVCELAYYILTTGKFELKNSNSSAIKVGPIAIDAWKSRSNFPTIIQSLLMDLGRSRMVKSSGISTAKLVRT